MNPQVLVAFQKVREAIKATPNDYANIVQREAQKLHLRSDETEVLLKHIAPLVLDTKKRKRKIEKRLEILQEKLITTPVAELRRLYRT